MTAAKISKLDPRLSLRGVRRHGAGWQVYRQVAGKLRVVAMPIETSAADLLAEWEKLSTLVAVPVGGSLADAVTQYLPRITAKATYPDIAAHLGRWLAELGRDRTPASVTSADIDQVIQKWLLTPVVIRNGITRKGLDPETVRRRLTSLQALFKATLPPGAVDPVRGCTRPKPKKPATRGLPMTDIVRILAAMPDRTTQGGASLAKIRATVTAFTGLDPAQIATLTRNDLVLTGEHPRFRLCRHKGGGTAVVDVPLTDAGREALQAFVDAQAFGPYAATGVNLAVRRAAAKVGFAPGTFRAKDLRHSFLTDLYRVTHDLATVARFALHREGSPMTARYARAANEEVDRSAARRFTVPTVPPPAKVLHLAQRRKTG